MHKSNKILLTILLPLFILGVLFIFIKVTRNKIGGDYYINDGNVYEKSWYSVEHIVPGADAKTFQYIGLYYAKDKNAVYHHTRKINEANPNTFQYIDHQFSKDDSHVFWAYRVIKEADPDTFKKINNATYRDKNNTSDSNGMIQK